MAMPQLQRYLRTLSCMVMAPLALWYLYPDPLSMYIAIIFELFAGFRAWLTPPVLFLLMNVVVLTLAFNSGFVKQRPQHTLDGEELQDLSKNGRRENAENDDDEAEDDDEEYAALYPEVFSSFFGDGVTATRRKPVLKRSASSPSAERKGHSFYPTFGSSRSQKLNPSPSLFASPNPPKTVSLQPPLKVLRPPVHTVPRAVTFDLKNPPPAPAAVNGNAEDRDVDQRADAFIGDFYKRMKVQQVDPYIERLERSYGS